MTNAAAATTSRRRRSRDESWSASSTVQWIGTGNTDLGRTPDTGTAPAGAVKAKVHYRYRGRCKKPTFRGPDLRKEVAGFQALLTAAHANDWPADETGRPLTPLPLPAVVEARTTDTDADGEHQDGS